MTKQRCLARLIREVAPTDVQVATLSVRPLRLAFLVDVQASTEDVLKYITYNTSIWGGEFNFLVPVRDSTIADYWWKSLSQCDPDLVVLCFEPKDELFQEIMERIQPFHIWPWFDSIAEHHPSGWDRYGSVPMRYVLWYLHEQLRPIKSSRVRVPQSESSSPFHLCAAAQFGCLEDDVIPLYSEDLKAEVVEIDTASLESYLASLLRFRGNLSPLSMTIDRLSTRSDQMSGMMLGAVFVLLSEKAWVEDLCVFWNLHACARTLASGSTEVVMVPYVHLSSEDNLRVFGKWVAEGIRGTNVLTLASAGLDAEELIKLRDRLRPLLPESILVDLWHDRFRFARFRATHIETSEEVRVTGRRLDLTLPRPSWWEKARSGMAWVADVQLGGHSITGPGKGYIPPRYPRLNYLLAGEPDQKWLGSHQPHYGLRLAHKCLSIRANKAAKYESIRLPEDDVLFNRLLLSRGYTSRLTDKSRYASSMIGLLGGLREARIFRDAGVRRLLQGMESGDGFTIQQMNQALRQAGKTTKYKPIDALKELVAGFTLKGILLRGYSLRCPACDLSHWYSFSEVAEKMTCAGCLTKLQPPLQAQFHYRLNELFVRGIEQGSIPILLTILMLSEVASESFLFVPGMEVERDGEIVDLDILAVCNGYLVISESKTLEEGLARETITELGEQLRRNLRVAGEVGASIFVLSMLLEHPPQGLQGILEELRKEHPRIAIHLATGTDLEKGYLYYTSRDGKEQRSTLEHLLPPSSVHEGRAGRIVAPGDRYVSIGGILQKQNIPKGSV